MTAGFRSVKFHGHTLFIAMSLCTGFAVSEQTVFRCGQEITNQPLDPGQCEKLLISSPTQIDGTRVQNGLPQKSSLTPTDTAPDRIFSTANKSQDAHQRNAQARTILEDEWQKLSSRHAEMVRLFNGGQPVLQEGESLQSAQYKRRASEMQTQIERMSRDLLALKRELTRHSSNLVSAQTK